MSTYVARIAELERHVKSLKLTLLGGAALAAFAMYLLNRGPFAVNVHTAPSMAPTVVEIVGGVAPVPKPNVYSFAFYVWQQLNRWHRDGSKDFGTQIFAFQDYITPRCRAFLESDMRKKAGNGELSNRTRSLSELPGGAYSAARVVSEGDRAWTVYLDVSLTETMRGQVVKDTAIRYPLRVVRYAVDLQRNHWQLALDCSDASASERLELKPSAGRNPAWDVPGIPRAVQQPGLPDPSDFAPAPAGVGASGPRN